MEGAILYGAHIEGASLINAKLSLVAGEQASFEGSNLAGADLEGADLSGAQIQGARLDDAVLTLADLTDAYVWRADIRKSASGGRDAHFYEPNAQAAIRVFPFSESVPAGCSKQSDCKLTKDVYSAWVRGVELNIPAGPLRDAALTGLLRIDPSTSSADDKTITDAWGSLGKVRPMRVDEESRYSKKLAALLEKKACDAANAPYVVTGLLFGPIVWEQLDDSEERSVVERLTDDKRCPGAHGLSDDDRQVYRKKFQIFP
jgi:hypothetical protein